MEIPEAAQLCLASESDNPSLANYYLSARIESSIGVFCAIFERAQDETITYYIVFRGSDDYKDWSLDVTAIPVRYRLDLFRRTRRVHMGFKIGYRSVRKRIRRFVRSAERIMVIGHSYGAALATLCSIDMHKIAPTSVYLFGSPKVGNPAFVDFYNNLGMGCFNVVHEKDLVPRLPPTILFKHVGNIIMISEDGISVIEDPTWDSLFDTSNPLRVVRKILSKHSIIGYAELTKRLFSGNSSYVLET